MQAVHTSYGFAKILMEQSIAMNSACIETLKKKQNKRNEALRMKMAKMEHTLREIIFMICSFFAFLVHSF